MMACDGIACPQPSASAGVPDSARCVVQLKDLDGDRPFVFRIATDFKNINTCVLSMGQGMGRPFAYTLS